MACPKCGSDEQTIVTIDQDPMGNDLHAIVCANGDCDHVYDQEEDAYSCSHWNYETDFIYRRWCLDCGAYLGEAH